MDEFLQNLQLVKEYLLGEGDHSLFQVFKACIAALYFASSQISMLPSMMQEDMSNEKMAEALKFNPDNWLTVIAILQQLLSKLMK